MEYTKTIQARARRSTLEHTHTHTYAHAQSRGDPRSLRWSCDWKLEDGRMGGRLPWHTRCHRLWTCVCFIAARLPGLTLALSSPRLQRLHRKRKCPSPAARSRPRAFCLIHRQQDARPPSAIGSLHSDDNGDSKADCRHVPWAPESLVVLPSVVAASVLRKARVRVPWMVVARIHASPLPWLNPCRSQSLAPDFPRFRC